MIVTPDGTRMLWGPKRDLIRGCIGMVMDHVVAECRGDEPFVYGLDGFDRWEPEQKLWLLNRVAEACLTSRLPPTRTAMFETTMDILWADLLWCVETEIHDPTLHRPGGSWRQSIVKCLDESPTSPPDELTREQASRLIARIADSMTRPHVYVHVETLRDGQPEVLQRFLRSKGLDEHYLSAIPPLVDVDHAQRLIDRISGLVFEKPMS